MNANQVEEYLRVLEEMVMDEEKIVTYKLVSRTLAVNVNIAKQLLHLYLIKQEKVVPSRVSATHLLAGLLKDGTFQVSIIGNSQLDEAYLRYERITSEHVYSIQKGKSSGLEKNSQMLFAVDSSLPPPKSYPIKYHKFLKEKTDEKVKKNTCQDVEVKAEVKSDEKQKENKGSSVVPRKDEKQTAKKAGHISNFFNNHSQRKKVDKLEKADNRNGAVKEEDVPKSVDKPEFPETLIPETEEEKDAKEKPSGSSKPAKKVKERKKRKRILSASEDSESDEERADALLRGEPEVSEVVETLRISDGDTSEDEIFESKKRKRKRVVSKNVLHDDGFMETFKEVVYETESDSESPKQKKKEEKISGDEITSGRTVEKVEKEESAGRKGKTPPQKGNPKKQSTLFSFFKKN